MELVDISLGGVLFKSKREYRIGEQLTIRIPILGSTTAFHCIVRRHVEFDKGYLGCGCEFTELTMLQEDQLYKFMLKKQNDQLKRVR